MVVGAERRKSFNDADGKSWIVPTAAVIRGGEKRGSATLYLTSTNQRLSSLGDDDETAWLRTFDFVCCTNQKRSQLNPATSAGQKNERDERGPEKERAE